MTLLKRFIGIKTNKFYLIILSILLISMITLFSFIEHYASIVNEIFQKNSYIVVSTKKDYYDMLVKNKYVTHIERCLLFKPDYTYDILGREGYEIRNQYGFLIDSREPEEVIRLNWEEFFARGSKLLNESILVFSSSENNLNLSNNQIALGITVWMYKGNLNDLIGGKIGFYGGKTKVEFMIDSTYESYSQEMSISNDAFENLSKTSNFYGYKIIMNDYRKAISLERKLERLEKNNSDSTVSLNRNFTNGDSKIDGDYRDMIEILTYLSYIVIFIFLLVAVNIIKKLYIFRCHLGAKILKKV